MSSYPLRSSFFVSLSNGERPDPAIPYVARSLYIKSPRTLLLVPDEVDERSNPARYLDSKVVSVAEDLCIPFGVLGEESNAVRGLER